MRHGDFWGTEFYSMRNLMHQLHSLNVVKKAVLEDGADAYRFLHLDLRYNESLAPVMGGDTPQ